MNHDVLTTSQARKALRLRSLQTVRSYIKREWLKGHRIGRQWLIDAASVEALIRNGPPQATTKRRRV